MKEIDAIRKALKPFAAAYEQLILDGEDAGKLGSLYHFDGFDDYRSLNCNAMDLVAADAALPLLDHIEAQLREREADTDARIVAEAVLDHLATYQKEPILHAIIACDFASRERMITGLMYVIDAARRETR